MDYWLTGEIDTGEGQKGILLKDGQTNRVLAISKESHGIGFIEACDFNYGVVLSEKWAKAALAEAICWIDSGNAKSKQMLDALNGIKQGDVSPEAALTLIKVALSQMVESAAVGMSSVDATDMYSEMIEAIERI